MPRNFDCGFLSSDAVEKEVDSALANDVFPESTWPNIPTETLQTRRPRRPRLCSGGGGVDGEDIIIPLTVASIVAALTLPPPLEPRNPILWITIIHWHYLWWTRTFEVWS